MRQTRPRDPIEVKRLRADISRRDMDLVDLTTNLVLTAALRDERVRKMGDSLVKRIEEIGDLRSKVELLREAYPNKEDVDYVIERIVELEHEIEDVQANVELPIDRAVNVALRILKVAKINQALWEMLEEHHLIEGLVAVEEIYDSLHDDMDTLWERHSDVQGEVDELVNEVDLAISKTRGA